MVQSKPEVTWFSLPTEIQREIFSLLPYWEIQKKRGVSKHWKLIADSVDPEYPDAQSQNVRRFCNHLITNFDKFYYFSFLDICERYNFNDQLIVYPYKVGFLSHDGKITNVTQYLKWYATAHRCDRSYSYIITGYIQNHRLIRLKSTCRCCLDCHKNHQASLCIAGKCKSCCNDANCRFHLKRVSKCPTCGKPNTKCVKFTCGQCCKYQSRCKCGLHSN